MYVFCFGIEWWFGNECCFVKFFKDFDFEGVVGGVVCYFGWDIILG